MKPEELPKLEWPNLAALERQYVVRDNFGRYGIARYDPVYHQNVLFAHPISLSHISGVESVPGTESLPAGAIILTNTPWHLGEDGKYHGVWCDYSGPIDIPDHLVRSLEIVDDLGWVLPDEMADRVCHPSPAEGNPEDAIINIRQAVQFCREAGTPVSARGLRKACARGHIPNAFRIGRDWLITYRALNHYLDNRPRRGRKSNN